MAAATAAWPLSGGGGGGGLNGASLGASLGSSSLATPAMTAAPSAAAARAVVPAAAPPNPPPYHDLLRVVLLQRTGRAAAVATAIGTAVLVLAVGTLRESLLLPGVWLSATVTGLLVMLPFFVAVKRSVQGTRGCYTHGGTQTGTYWSNHPCFGSPLLCIRSCRRAGAADSLCGHHRRLHRRGRHLRCRIRSCARLERARYGGAARLGLGRPHAAAVDRPPGAPRPVRVAPAGHAPNAQRRRGPTPPRHTAAVALVARRRGMYCRSDTRHV